MVTTTPVVTPAPVVIVKTIPGPKEVITKTIVKEVQSPVSDVLPQYANIANPNSEPNYTTTIIGLVIVWLLTGMYHKRKENMI